MADDRGWLGDSWAFAESLGKGAWDAGAGMVEGLGNLAEGGYKLATDEKAREAAWETTKQLADAAGNYGEAVLDDPGKAYRDARDGALAAYDRFEQAKNQAAAEGRSAEFWGEGIGGAAFEVGSMLVPVGLAAKAGKLGKVASAADKVSDVADAAKKLDNAEDALSVAHRAKGVVANPAIKASDDTISSVKKCRNKDSADGRDGDITGAKGADEVNSNTVFSGHGAHSNKLTTVPEGTSVTVYSGPGGSITDELGNIIETGGDLSKVPKKTYHSGEQMPDNILYEPNGLDIQGSPITVEKPTRLSELLRPDMGECHWAACTSASGEKFSDTVFHIDGMYDQLGNKIKSYD